MAEIIIMPKLGFDMDEGQLIKWHKSAGDTIRAGELFFEINTDKTTMPVESPIDGTVLRLLVDEGDFAPVFTPIAVVGSPDEDADEALAAHANSLKVTVRESQSSGAGRKGLVDTAAGNEKGMSKVEPVSLEGMKLTPRARRFIKENDISPALIARVVGSGFEGGVTESDIKNYLSASGGITSGGAAPGGVSSGSAANIKASPLARIIAGQDRVELSGITGTGTNGKIMKADVERRKAEDAEQGSEDGSKAILSSAPYKGIRKIIGDKLASSMAQSPHIFFTAETDAGPMIDFRTELSEAYGEKITVTDMLVMAASIALMRYPGVNSSLVNDNIITYSSTNIGIAVAGERGLIVPAIKDVQKKSIKEVAKASRDLIDRARAGSLKPEEYSGGTFTISNLGMFGIDSFTAIINPPEAAIIAVGAVKKRPVVVTVGGEDEIVIKNMMNIRLSADHRLIDGLLAARFVDYYRHLLENPGEIISNGVRKDGL